MRSTVELHRLLLDPKNLAKDRTVRLTVALAASPASWGTGEDDDGDKMGKWKHPGKLPASEEEWETCAGHVLGPATSKKEDRDAQKANSTVTLQLTRRVTACLVETGLLWFVNGGVEFLSRWWVRECFKNNGVQRLVNEGHKRLREVAEELEDINVEGMDSAGKQVPLHPIFLHELLHQNQVLTASSVTISTGIDCFFSQECEVVVLKLTQT